MNNYYLMLNPSTIAKEAYVIYAHMIGKKINQQMPIKWQVNDHDYGERSITVKFDNESLVINSEIDAMALSLDEFSKKFIVPAVQRNHKVIKTLKRENKVKHMKRRLSCKNHIHLA